MKKIAILFAIVLASLTCFACNKTPAPTVTPSTEQSVEQSTTPSVEVTPSVESTIAPTVAPSVEISEEPTAEPTVESTAEPTVEPTAEPTVEPTVEPSAPGAAELLAAVTFSNRSIRYNGTYQKLEVKNLPEGAEVVYSVNEATTSADNEEVYNAETGVKFPGVYGITATVSLDGTSVELSAVLTLNKAKLTITADSHSIDLYAPHPEFTYTVSGLVGEDVFYPGQDPALPPTEEEESSKANFIGWLTLSTKAERYSEAGIYDITVEGITSNCYDITYKKGKLTIKNYTTDLVVGGLKKNGNNQMTYNGKVVEWQGVNYYGLIENSMNFGAGTVNEAGVQAGMRGLEELAEYNVKAIRFSACFYYKSWWDSAYMKNDQQKEDLMYLIKRFFNKAASLNIGLIPSVFWTSSATEVVGGNPLSFADPNSEGFKFAMQYQRDLLDAVNDHPALFMWEFGNEWNLSMDIGHEGLTAKHIHDMRVEWTKIIEERNTYGRVIGSGDAIMRPAAWNLYNNSSWAVDTEEQHTEMIRYINPGMTAISTHIYTEPHLVLLMNYLVKEEEERLWADGFKIMTDAEKEAYRMSIRRDYFENPEKYTAEGGLFDQYNVRNGRTSAYIADIDTLTEQFRFYVETAKALNATCYIGEAGASYTYGETVIQNGEFSHQNGYWPDLTYDDLRDYSRYVTEAQNATGMPLILYWNYSYNIDISHRGNANGPWDDVGKGGNVYSFSLKNMPKAHIVLEAVKAQNDAWDAANV